MAVLYRCHWLLPIVTPPIADGAVIVADGRIAAAGRYRDLRGGAGEREIDGVLLPSLVNCHAHLELSSLGGVARSWTANGRAGDLAGWIRSLLAARAEQADDRGQAAQAALAGMHREGVGLLVDIGNLPESGRIADDAGVKVSFLLEKLGVDEQKAESLLNDAANESCAVTAHAPYSCSGALIRGLKTLSRTRDGLFSIHLAESEQELILLAGDRGPLHDFLAERGLADVYTAPRRHPVTWLDELGVLDPTTLCVHCVQMGTAEIELLARRGAKICLCPVSNRTLGVGEAPVQAMLAAGILPGLGTDSLASNPQLSLWNELREVQNLAPAIDPATIIAMGTLGGARALGLENDYGTIEPGKAASLISVRLDGATGAESMLAELLSTTTGDKVQWLQP
ncbi:MAG: amidohydrolase family protein [Thermodesulfobacteriota bacterium]